MISLRNLVIKHKFITCVILFTAIMSNTSANVMQHSKVTPTTAHIDYNNILQSVHQDQLSRVSSIATLDSQVTDDITKLNKKTGKYIDLNYSDHKRIGVDWQPALMRMNRMTLAYSHPDSRYYHNESSYQSINRSLYYFCHYKPLPYCDNWFQQGITRPQSLAMSLINMWATGKTLPDSTMQLAINAICKDTSVNSPGRNNPMHRYNYGANKAEISLGWICIGALIKNAHMVAIGARELYAPLKYTEGEGIQYDRSFDMHYGYLYNGAYGTVLLESITTGAWYLRETAYALHGEKLKFFGKFIRESIFDQVRGRSIDWNTLGRSISRYNATRPDFRRTLKRLMTIDFKHRDLYLNALLRVTGQKTPSYKIRATHQHYWQTDFTVHSRPSFYLSVHGVSDRNHAQEIGNQENMKGYWGAEGVMDLMVSGNEYTNIFPLWNWKRLPGTTLPDTLIIPSNKAPGEGDRRGTSPFCGGVSDSLNGLTVYEIKNDLGLYARKAWFMINDVIYCLGSGIHANLSKEIRTTLNQCLYDSIGVVVGGHNKTLYLKEPIDTVFGEAPNFILHANIAYLPYGTNPLGLKVETRSSDWKEINSRAYPTQKKAIFELSINHGINPTNSSYCYVLLPGVHSIKKIKKFRYHNECRITNTDSIQAIHAPRQHMTQIAFYKPNISYDISDINIQSNKPCLVMLQEMAKGKYKLSVSEPTCKEKEIRICVSKSSLGISHSFEIELPGKFYAGKTVSTIFTF